MMSVQPTGSSVPAVPSHRPSAKVTSQTSHPLSIDTSTITHPLEPQNIDLLTTIGNVLYSAVEVMINFIRTCASKLFPLRAETAQSAPVMKENSEIILSATVPLTTEEPIPIPVVRVFSDAQKTKARFVFTTLAKICTECPGAHQTKALSEKLIPQTFSLLKAKREIINVHPFDLLHLLLTEIPKELKKIHASQAGDDFVKILLLRVWIPRPWTEFIQQVNAQINERMTRHPDPHDPQLVRILLKELALRLKLSSESLLGKFESLQTDPSTLWEKLIVSIMNGEIQKI